jgi:hypothetical protein
LRGKDGGVALIVGGYFQFGFAPTLGCFAQLVPTDGGAYLSGSTEPYFATSNCTGTPYLLWSGAGLVCANLPDGGVVRPQPAITPVFAAVRTQLLAGGACLDQGTNTYWVVEGQYADRAFIEAPFTFGP